MRNRNSATYSSSPSAPPRPSSPSCILGFFFLTLKPRNCESGQQRPNHDRWLRSGWTDRGPETDGHYRECQCDRRLTGQGGGSSEPSTTLQLNRLARRRHCVPGASSDPVDQRKICFAEDSFFFVMVASTQKPSKTSAVTQAFF